MKIRRGYVSNSSSSSFILSLDKKPETVEEMKELLFGDQEYYYDPFYSEDSDYFSKRTARYPTLTVAETVFNDLKDQKPMTLEEVSEELSCVWIDSTLEDGTKRPDFDDFRKDKDSFDTDWKAYEKESKKFHDNLAKELFEESKGKELYVVEYSDDFEYGCALEHGPLFDKIDAFRISKH